VPLLKRSVSLGHLLLGDMLRAHRGATLAPPEPESPPEPELLHRAPRTERVQAPPAPVDQDKLRKRFRAVLKRHERARQRAQAEGLVPGADGWPAIRRPNGCRRTGCCCVRAGEVGGLWVCWEVVRGF